jgi:DNA polymerase III subunit epsilon
MNYLIFDTETTGFPNKKVSEYDKSQARCVQLACLLVNSEFETLTSFYTILSLDEDKTIDAGAQAAHGITKEMCDAHGMAPELVVDVFSELYQMCDVVVAHNLRFDKSIIDIEAAIRGYKHVWNKKEFCTMDATTDLCKMIGKIPGKYKWPKLEEALSILCNHKLEGAHDAMADVKGCLKLLQYLKEKQVGTPPAILSDATK